jgi:hypothetical protein
MPILVTSEPVAPESDVRYQKKRSSRLSPAFKVIGDESTKLWAVGVPDLLVVEFNVPLPKLLKAP